MLRTNLSTRPFYNIRAVQVALGALALLVIVLTLLNLVQLIRLTSSGRALGARAAAGRGRCRSACATKPGAFDRRSTRRN